MSSGAAAAAGASGTGATFPQSALPSASGGESFEYLVVGAGMIGAAAAFYLSQSSSGVAVIGSVEPDDFSKHEGPFSSHYDASRFYRTLDTQRSWAVASHRSMQRYRDIEKASGIRFHRPTGNLRVYPPSKADGIYFDIDALEQTAKASGLDVEINRYTSTEGLSRDFPYFSFPDGMHGNYETPETAGVIDPRKLVSAHLKLARSEGAAVIEGQVVSVESGKNGVEVTTGDGRRFRTRKVVLATGGWTNLLLRRQLSLSLVGLTVLMAELDDHELARLAEQPCLMYHERPEDPVSTLYYHMPAVEYPDGKRYMKLGLWSPVEGFDSHEDLNKHFKLGGNAIDASSCKDMLAEFMPTVKPRSYFHKPCVTVMTPTRLPYIDEVEPRVFVATGGNATAAKCSDELGRLTAQLVATGTWDDEEIPAHEFTAIHS